MKIKNKIIIISILVLFIIISIFGVIFFINSDITSNKSNIQIDNDVEGEYSGCQLTLTASYGGSGIAGQDLGSGIETQKYNISDNDIFYEPGMGGIWILNLEQEDDTTKLIVPTTILKINKIGNENIELEYGNKKHIENYDEEIRIPSNNIMFDGINYSYTIIISKEN